MEFAPADLYNYNGTVTRGWEQVNTNRQSSYPNLKGVTFEVRDVRVEMFGADGAVVMYYWTQSQTSKGVPDTSTGRTTLVFRKIAGAWKVVHTHASPDTPSIPRPSTAFAVAMNVPWTNTGVQIESGQNFSITATGIGVWKNISPRNPNAKPNAYEECTPEGTTPNSQDYFSNIQQYQTPNANKGALIGKIGENGLPFKVGTSFNQTANQTGVIFLGINDMRPEVDPSSYADNSGSFQATVQIAQDAQPLIAKRTTPKGSILGDQTTGLFYANPNNSYELGVAYKDRDIPRVYIYDGQNLRPVPDEATFLRFYDCTAGQRVIDCAPVYQMPNSGRTIGPSLPSAQTPIPTTATPQPISRIVTVPSTVQWYDTGIDVPAGAVVQLTYKGGHWTNIIGSNFVDGEGKQYEKRNLLMVPRSYLASFVARVGTYAFHVGNSYRGQPGSGRLYLSLNDIPKTFDDNEGELDVNVEVR